MRPFFGEKHERGALTSKLAITSSRDISTVWGYLFELRYCQDATYPLGKRLGKKRSSYRVFLAVECGFGAMKDMDWQIGHFPRC